MTFFGGAGQDAHYYALFAPIGNPAGGSCSTAAPRRSTPNRPSVAAQLYSGTRSRIDKSGRYVFLYPSAVDLGSPRNASQVYIWDTDDRHDHADHGGDAARRPRCVRASVYWINQDCCTSSTWDAAQWQFRSLATPAQTNDLITPVQLNKEIYMADHTTWNNAQPETLVPVISATYRYGANTAAWRAWDDEIIGIDTTNGIGGTVWRFAHHRSAIGSDSDPTVPYFWYEPRPNVSPNGQWVIFTSNWEKTLGTDSADGTARQDVFLVQLTPLQ